MNMKDFHSWVKAGEFDKPKMVDDTMHTRRLGLGQEDKSVLETIQRINNISTNGDQRTTKK